MSKKSRAEVEAEVRSRVATEERAYRWVERLALTESITKDEMAKMVGEIMSTHYEDIVEERAISKVCGYPLCSKQLGDRSPHKYRISTKHNKVIDLDQRESFCTVYCMKASKYVENQIPDTPIWLRHENSSLKMKFLPKEEAPKFTGVGELPLSMENLELDDVESTVVEKEDSDHEDATEKIQVSNYKNRDKNKGYNEKVKSAYTKTKEVKFVKKEPKEEVDSTQNLNKVNGVLKEWFTCDSYEYLQMLSSSSQHSDDEDVEAAFQSIYADDFQSKVNNFLSSQPEWISESTLGRKDNRNKNSVKKLILPTVDSKSQHVIRRRIVHEKVSVSSRELLPLCGVLESDLTEAGFFKLLDTFNFSSKNIVLNTKQWMLVTVVLLKIFFIVSTDYFVEMGKRTDEINNYLSKKNLPNIQEIEKVAKDLVAKAHDGFDMEELD